jgi:serine/threonine protein kinase
MTMQETRRLHRRKPHLDVLDLASSLDLAWSTPLPLSLDTTAAAGGGGGATNGDRSKYRRRFFLSSLRQRRRCYLGHLVRVLFFVVVGYISTKSSSSMFGSFRWLRKSAAYNGPTIVFSRHAFSGSPQTSDGRHRSLVTPAMTLRKPMLPDYNNLGMAFFHDTTNVKEFWRVISNDDDAILHRERLEMLDEIDEYDVSVKYEHTDEYIVENPRFQCLRNNWAFTPKPVCNNLHEVPIDFHAKSVVQQAYKIKYLSHGYYRDTWLLDPRRPEMVEDREFVLKTLRAHDFDIFSMRKVEIDALIMERLSTSNLIVDIYGHCGTSIMAEAMPGEISDTIVPENGAIESYDWGHMHQTDLDVLQETDVHPMNSLTAMEKLDLALLMAESLAELHGAGIVHGDVDPKQWLKAADGSIKLNDFNNGHLLEWSCEYETYCEYRTYFEGGIYKAPEELDEDCKKGSNKGTDVWAMGHAIYGLLTGLGPYYRTFSHSRIREMVREGRKPFIDERYRSRSLIEARLVEVMEPCWEFEAAGRPSIFDIVKHLRETKRLYSKEYPSHSMSEIET